VQTASPRNIAGTEDSRGRLHYLEWCLDDVKASELKEGKRKASPKCGFASYDRYATVSRSGSRYTLATRRRTRDTLKTRPANLFGANRRRYRRRHRKRRRGETEDAFHFLPGSFHFRSRWHATESRAAARGIHRETAGTRAEITASERFLRLSRLMTCFRSR